MGICCGRWVPFFSCIKIAESGPLCSLPNWGAVIEIPVDVKQIGGWFVSDWNKRAVHQCVYTRPKPYKPNTFYHHPPPQCIYTCIYIHDFKKNCLHLDCREMNISYDEKWTPDYVLRRMLYVTICISTSPDFNWLGT